jgi:hypothetical protein
MTEAEILSTGTDVEELEEQTAPTYVNAANNQGQVAGKVYGGMHQTIIRKVKGLREAHELGPDYVRRVQQTYVERSFEAGRDTLNLTEVVERLRVRSSITLIGPPGTGRRTAAIAVLGGLGVRLAEIPSWDPGQPGQFTVADLPAEPDTGYLFVHPDNEVANVDLGNELRSYEEKLYQIQSFLVFVATETAWQAAGRTYSEGVLTVGSPDGQALLDMSVRSRDPHRDLTPVLAAPRISSIAASAAPRDVIRLGDLVVDTPVDPKWNLDSESDLEKLIDEITSGYQEWTNQITLWLKQHSEAHERLFLIAAAVLEGSPASLILRYAEELRQLLLDEVQPRRHSITAPGVRELAEIVGADLLVPDNRLRFRRPAYAAAVIDYLLADRSDAFRVTVSEWLAKAPKINRQGEAAVVADLVAATVLDVVRRRGDITFAIPVVNTWAAPRSLRQVLVPLLTAVALSNEAGAAMRARLNRWATKSKSQPLCEVVADVCTGDLADTYPHIALTRINNLAVRASGPLVDIVVESVIKLWDRDAMRRDVLQYIVAWLGDRDAPAFVVGTQVLAALGADTIRVAFEERLDSAPGLSTAVANVLISPDEPERLRDTLYGWLDIAVPDEMFADWLIDVIAAAIPGPNSALRITCVWTFACGWEKRSPDPSRTRLRERLVDRVSDADTMIRRWTMAVEQKGAIDEPSD